MLLRPAASLLSVIALTQCASGPDLDRWVELSDQEPVIVSFHQPGQAAGQQGKAKRELRQTLVTDAIIEAESLYSSKHSDPLTKVVSIENMQLLLDGFATGGYFTWATATEPPADAPTVSVELRGERISLFPHGTIGQQGWDSYRRALQMFQDLYNSTEAFHAGDDARVFQKEQQRLDRKLQNKEQELHDPMRKVYE